MKVSLGWIKHLPLVAQQHPKATAAVGAAAVLGGWLYFSSAEPVVVKAKQVEVKKIAASVTEHDTVEGRLGQTIQRLDKSEKTNEELGKTLKAVQQELREASDARAKDKELAEQRAIQDQRRREEDIARATKERQKTTTQAKVVTQPSHGQQGPPPAPTPKQFELRMVGNTNKDSTTKRIPPRLHQEDTAYLGEGSVAQARVMTGVLASGRGHPNPPGSEGDMPILLSVTGPFDSAWMLHGPERNPEPTSVPIQGCRMFGHARADLSSSRVYIHLHLLVCVMPDKTTYPVRIRGYVLDGDGNNGLVGRLETRDSAMIAKAAVLAVTQEAAALVGLARSSVVVTSNAGAYQQMGTGVQSSIQQLTQYFLDNARLLGPVLWVESGVKAQVVMLEGVALEGFPTMVALEGGR